MAQTGFTPILIYSSSTASNAPAVGNLTNSTLGSELAINITDGKLFYKDNANAIQVIGWKLTPTTAGGTGTSTTFTAGSVVFAGASGVYSQNNANFFWDNTNIRLGLNNSAPTATLEIGTIASTGRYIQVNGSNADASYIVLKGTKQFPRIDLEDNSVGGSTFQMWNLGNQLRFGTNPGSAALSAFNVAAGNAANVTFNGNVVIGTSGKGIDFSATPGTGTSELLADYEEGDWTPTVVGDITAGTATYSNQIARYTKIGSRVFFACRLVWTGGTGTGAMRVNGLPYTSASITNNFLDACSIIPSDIGLTALNYAVAYVFNNSAFISIEQSPVGGGSSSAVTYDAAGSLNISGSYLV